MSEDNLGNTLSRVESLEEKLCSEETVQVENTGQSLEAREEALHSALTKLENIYKALAEREEALRKKEETLNAEYLKILELESMYQRLDKLSDSLDSVLPSLNTGEINLGEALKKIEEDN